MAPEKVTDAELLGAVFAETTPLFEKGPTTPARIAQRDIDLTRQSISRRLAELADRGALRSMKVGPREAGIYWPQRELVEEAWELVKGGTDDATAIETALANLTDGWEEDHTTDDATDEQPGDSSDSPTDERAEDSSDGRWIDQLSAVDSDAETES